MTSLTMITYFIPVLLAWVNGVWVPNQIVPITSTNPLNAVACTVVTDAPWFGTFLFYAIYASALIFIAANEGKFIRFSFASFGMIFLGIAFVHFGCVMPSGGVAIVESLMPQVNILAPIAGFILTLIASIIWG